MSSKSVFNEIMATNLLIFMSGVIPSFSTFQFMLCRRINDFALSLQKEGHARPEIDALLRLLFHISKKMLQKHAKKIAPGKTAPDLSQEFFPKNEENIYSLQHHQLLMQSQHPDIVDYVQTISTLFPSSELLTASVPIIAIAESSQRSVVKARPQALPNEVYDFQPNHKICRLIIRHLLIAAAVLIYLWFGCYGYLEAGL